MLKFNALIIFLILFPFKVWGICASPQINKSFLKPYENKINKWIVHDTHFYKNQDLGLSQKFESNYTTVDFYIYNLGKNKITKTDIDKELRSSISEMIYFYKKYEPDAEYSQPLLISEKFFNKTKKLINKAVFILVKKNNGNEISLVSIGFDGKCFQKIRFTKKIMSQKNIKQFFKNPTHNKEILGSLYEFTGFVSILNNELLRSGYYK